MGTNQFVLFATGNTTVHGATFGTLVVGWFLRIRTDGTYSRLGSLGRDSFHRRRASSSTLPIVGFVPVVVIVVVVVVAGRTLL